MLGAEASRCSRLAPERGNHQQEYAGSRGGEMNHLTALRVISFRMTLQRVVLLLVPFVATYFACADDYLREDLDFGLPLNQNTFAVSGQSGVYCTTSLQGSPVALVEGGYDFAGTPIEGVQANRSVSSNSVAQTWMAWIRPDSMEAPGIFTATHPYSVLLGLNGTSMRGFLRLFDRQVQYGWNDGSNWINVQSQGEEIPTGVWSHICGSNDGVNAPTIFINGVERAVTLRETGDFSLRVSLSNFRVAYQYTSGHTRPFDGAIRDVRVYAGALSATDIAAVATAPTDFIAEEPTPLPTPEVPGVVIDHSPASTNRYIGSPSIAVLPNGHYVASHDFFGSGSSPGETSVFQSEDKGETWQHIADIDGQYWSNLFVYNGLLYIMGPNRSLGHIVIRQSTDGGRTWTDPVSAMSGLLSESPGYHTAPMPVVVHQGRLWRSMELGEGPRENWASFVMSASVDADLLRADHWSWSNMLYHPTVPDLRWIEGNIVVTPDNKLVNILRTNDIGVDKAAIVRVSEDGRTVSFDAENDIIDFPGGGAKFTIRYDEETARYWSLVNKQKDPAAYRNRLVLTSSSDLIHWSVESVILEHPDSSHVAWQYVDWHFEERDIIAVSRTAYDDGLGGAHSAHDANYMTFHRIQDFRGPSRVAVHWQVY